MTDNTHSPVHICLPVFPVNFQSTISFHSRIPVCDKDVLQSSKTVLWPLPVFEATNLLPVSFAAHVLARHYSKIKTCIGYNTLPNSAYPISAKFPLVTQTYITTNTGILVLKKFLFLSVLASTLNPGLINKG